jgi:uncharacterized protein (DUF952 family)
LDNEGFIHCSTKTQVSQVANAFYRDVPNLILLCIDEDTLASPLKWEAPVHPNADAENVPTDSELFPHVYGPINVDAVVQTVALERTANGDYTLSDETP